MKILYYNWIQFDNRENQGGGVNVYQRNLIDYLTKNTEHEIYFLSSGWKYNPLNKKTYIVKTQNIYGSKCKSFEIINSSIMAPAFAIYMNPMKFIEDFETYEIFDKFIQEQGGFDVIHFNNIEGISINVLKLKEKYPNTKFIVSIHNYQPICPLNQYFQNHNKKICHDFQNGKECLKCSLALPDGKEYCRRSINYYNCIFDKQLKFFKFPLKLFVKFFKYRSKKFIGSNKTMIPEQYDIYRKYNIETLNKYADTILAVSKRVYMIMIEHGCNPSKVIVSYIGTKFAQNEIKHSIATVQKPFTIAYLGYKRVDKGFFFFIDALSKLDKTIAENINVVLAVSRIRKNDYEDELSNFNKVIVYNGYTHNNLSNILKNVNLGIVPVLWEDNLPQVAIEMVALGVPVLCSDFGGASELSKSELFKFKGGCEEDFIEKLTKIVNNPELLQEYWVNHGGLMKMEKHVDELMQIYASQEKKTVLVTGGAGFIGSYVVGTLINNNINVIAVDNFSSGKLENLNKKCKFYNFDILSNDIETVFKENKIDIVVHLAAQVSVNVSQNDSLFDASINIMGTLNILKFCKLYNVQKIIAASSAAVYGDKICPIKENVSLNPMSNYGISKMTMEQYIRNSGLDYLLLRFSNVYGKGQNQSGEAGVITIFNNLMTRNADISIFGDGNQIRDFVSSNDVADIIYKLIEKKQYNKTINISTGSGISINQLFELMKKSHCYKKQPIYKNKREGDIEVSILDNSCLMELFPDYKFRDFEVELNKMNDVYCCIGGR